MNEALKICGCALLFIAASAVMHESGGKRDVFLPAAAIMTLLIFSVSSIGEIALYLRGITEKSTVSGYLGLLFKAGAIAFITDLTAEICRSSNEGTVAGYVEFAGRTEILLLSLPLIDEILAMSLGLLP